MLMRVRDFTVLLILILPTNNCMPCRIQTVLLYIDKMPAVNITQDHSATAVQMNHRTGHTYCMGLTLQPSYIHENMTIRSHLHTFTIIANSFH